METNTNQTKKLLLSLFAMLMPLLASGHDFEVDGIYYSITSSTELTVEVTHKGSSYVEYSNEYSGAIDIPELVTYASQTYRVTAIDDYAFSQCRNLKSVFIPKSVDEIRSYAFNECLNLDSVFISEGVYKIGYNAFRNCNKLVSISIPESVTEIESYALNTTGWYKNQTDGVVYAGNVLYKYKGTMPIDAAIEIKEGTISISQSAFFDCSNLASLTIPGSVVSIGNYAFGGCTSLRELTFKDGNDTLSLGYNNYNWNSSSNNQGESLFYHCPLEKIYLGRNLKYETGAQYGFSPFYNKGELIYVTVGDGVCSMGDYAFSNCSNLSNIKIPDRVIELGDYAFCNCTSLTFINIPDSVNSIGHHAFYNCNSLTSIIIPKSVEEIGRNAFNGCTGELMVNCNIPSSSSNEGGVFYNNKFTKISIGNDVTSIGDYAFYNSKNLTSVIIPASVIQIGEYAFYGCYYIHSLTIGSGVRSIGYNAFNFPDKVIWLTNTPPSGYNNAKGDINYVANEQYTGLSNAKIYTYLSSMFEVDGVKYVPVSPADRICDVIDCVYDNTASSIKVEETVSFKGVTMKVKAIMPYTFYENKYIKDAVLAHNGAIGDYAFYNCTSLLTATLGSNITALGKETFSQCASLPKIIIPDSVKSIGESCFSGCTVLKGVTIGAGITSIEKGTFSDCSLLSEITIPQKISTIEDYVFSRCSNLSTFIIKDRNTSLNLGSNASSALFADCPLDSVYIGGKIAYSTSDYKGYSPFYRNTSLRTVVITDEETQIYDNEFYGCTALKNVSIGDGVTSIGDYAFSGCNSLEALSFGSSIKKIGAEAFSDCNNVTKIVSSAVYPPICGLQALDDINKWNCQLNVPIGYKEPYTEAEQWKEFFFIEDNVVVPYYALTFIVDSIVYRVDSLPCGEFIIIPDEPIKEGHTFSGWSEVPEAMPASDVTISGSFAINSYILEYIVDGDVYKTDTITYGDSITIIPPLVKEGYTFSGWSEAPAIMTADSVVITGSFAINSYLLTYTVDGDTVQADSVVYGTEITVIDEPSKEGYTFSGWSEVPEAMPANDVTISGTFTTNKYLVTFKIDGEVIAADSLEYGAAIVAPEVPEKEGHTFKGWIDGVETVPANDVTIEGSYSVNSYLLAYMVDGDIIQADSVTYGTAITLLDEPTKEGYTFSGWGEAPETMPAEDVTISGTFSINQYTVTYVIDGEVFATDTITYGESITLPDVPAKEGYDFAWTDEIPETMPAKDIVINGSYTTGIIKAIVEANVLYIYTMDGQRVNELRQGINIVLLKDGSIRKVFQK